MTARESEFPWVMMVGASGATYTFFDLWNLSSILHEGKPGIVLLARPKGTAALPVHFIRFADLAAGLKLLDEDPRAVAARAHGAELTLALVSKGHTENDAAFRDLGLGNPGTILPGELPPG